MKPQGPTDPTSTPKHKSVIYTLKEKCRVCYTCVRECPAKAIGIANGQAEIIDERCISCGNCVKVCGQGAKRFHSSIESVERLFSESTHVAAIIAPSFPAEFDQLPYSKVVGALKKLGFASVYEVGFGADLVAHEYQKLLWSNSFQSYIATTCPAIVSYVEKYHPELIPNLAPIVSPMVAMARVVRELRGSDVKIVFIGPCLAKKTEVLRSSDGERDVDEAITFAELRGMFRMRNVDLNQVQDGEFDPPLSGEGGVFAITRGLLQAAKIQENLVASNVITADGKNNFREALKEFSNGYLDVRLLETLSCEGCVMGPGMTSYNPLYRRRHLVAQYMKTKMDQQDADVFQADMERFKSVDLRCRFTADPQTIDYPEESEIQEVLRRLGKTKKEDELDCGACGYERCREHAIAILRGLAESEMCLPYTIETLKNTVRDLEGSYRELKSVKETLNHRERLASMGQLSAGIAHELNNPLGIILMYANLLAEQEQCPNELKSDLTMVVDQANRCKKIVSGLLNFSRQNKVIRVPTDLVDLTGHCMDSVSVPEGVRWEVVNRLEKKIVEIDKDQISQVIINLVNNAADAMEEKGGVLQVILEDDMQQVSITVKDTGPGIPEKYRKQIFDPFFTTKQIGKGTGLGLPVSYGIIKMHMGSITVNTNTDLKKGPVGTSVIVTLPRHDVALPANALKETRLSSDT